MPADFKQSANLAGKVLASGQCASGDNTVYTVPASSATKVATISLSNVTVAAVTISVSVVPSGQTLDATRTVLASFSLAARDAISAEDVLSFLKGSMLDAGTVISVNAATAAAVNYLLTGAVSS